MVRRLFLHVGTGKTGSSALQNAYALSQNILAQSGIAYPVVATARNKPPLVSSGNAASIRKAFREEGAAAAIAAAKELLDPKLDTLLSNEGLYATSQADLASLREALDAAGWHTKVLVFFRPQADLLASAYLQRLKANKHLPEVDENEYALAQYKSEHFDWLGCAQKLESVFGINNLSVHWYPAVLRYGGSVSAAFEWLGISSPHIAEPRINPSPGREAAMVLREANAAGIGGRRFADEFLRRAQDQGLLGSKVTLAPDVHRLIEDQCRKANSELLRRYCPDLSPENELTAAPTWEPPPLNQNIITELKRIAGEVASSMNKASGDVHAAFGLNTGVGA
jgi:hypothetical protein